MIYKMYLCFNVLYGVIQTSMLLNIIYTILLLLLKLVILYGAIEVFNKITPGTEYVYLGHLCHLYVLPLK